MEALPLAPAREDEPMRPTSHQPPQGDRAAETAAAVPEASTSARLRARSLPRSLATRLYRAAEPIAERGLDQTTMEDIATASGVAKATLYYHFAGKEDILAFLLGEMLRLVRDAVASAMTTPGTARQRLAAIVHAQLSVMFAHPAICQTLVGDLGRAGRIPEIADAIRAAFHTPVERLIVEGASDGTLRATIDPATASSVLFGAVTVTGLTHLIDRDGAPAAQVAENVLGMVLTGLGPMPHS